MNNILGALSAVSLLPPVDAANTAAASSAYIDCKQYEGIFHVLLFVGIINAGTVTFSFLQASSSGGAGEAALTPVSGAPTVVTTSNDNPFIELATFDARQTLGFIKVVGTLATTTSALVGYALLGVKKYG